MPESKSYNEWLQEFREKIQVAYEKQRLDKQLAGYVYDVDKPVRTLPKGSGPYGVFVIREGEELPPPYVLSSQQVEPINIGFSLDITGWAQDPERYVMDVLLSNIGRNLAQREAFVILKGMIDKAGRSIQVKEKGKLTKSDLLEAERWIKTQGFHADTLVLHPKLENAFRMRGELIEASKIPQLARDKGSHFSGIIDGLNIYWTPIIEKYALLYKKSEIVIAKTPLKIEFDNTSSPSKLITERWCSSVPVDERSVVRIEI